MESKVRVAIVHDYLNQMGGAERVVGVLHKMFPTAPIYTTIVDKEKLLPELKEAIIRPTWLQKIPGILKNFKLFFWLYPFGIETMKLKEYDLIISSSSAYAKGVRKGKQAIHICYCHTPMRFAWDFETYVQGLKMPLILKILAKMLVIPLQMWDKFSSRRVDFFIANSSIVEKRINNIYGIVPKKIFPPVDISRFQGGKKNSEEFFLVVSRLVSYKRIDLAVQACSKLGKRLVVIGDGPDRKRLEEIAGPTVEFLGRVSDENVEEYMKSCKAFIFPGLEDFGITPLEVNACGRPVIAFKGGGALDTIYPGINGQFFEEQSVESLIELIEKFDAYEWDYPLIREHAEKYSEEIFVNELTSFINQVLIKEYRI